MSSKGIEDPITSSAGSQRLRSWLREPLLHFLLIGALLFAMDHVLLQRRGDPLEIIISAEVDRQVRQLFQGARGREPDVKEVKALHQAWLDNEVLYREGLAMELDRGDEAIRERVIFKALSVVNAGVKLPPHDDTLLRAWFEANRTRYDEPPRYDFQEAVLSGDGGDAAVRTLVQRLNSGVPGDLDAGLRVFTGRPLVNLQQSYGEAFVAALNVAPLGSWLAVPAGQVQRVVRVEKITPAVPAQFETLRGVVLQDWTDNVMADQRTAAVRAMAQKYRIRVEAAQ